MSDWFIHTCHKVITSLFPRKVFGENMKVVFVGFDLGGLKEVCFPKFTFFLSLPLIWQRRFTPSKHIASRRPLPNIFVTFDRSTCQLWGIKAIHTSHILCISRQYATVLFVFLILIFLSFHGTYLGILLAILFEDELSLQALVLVLPPPPVLSSLSFVLRHLAPKGWSQAVCLLVKLSQVARLLVVVGFGSCRRWRFSRFCRRWRW